MLTIDPALAPVSLFELRLAQFAADDCAVVLPLAGSGLGTSVADLAS